MKNHLPGAVARGRRLATAMRIQRRLSIAFLACVSLTFCRCDSGDEAKGKSGASEDDDDEEDEDEDSPKTGGAGALDMKIDRAGVEAAVDDVFKPLIDDGWTTGIIVGVVAGEDSYVVSLGRLSPDDEDAPDETTIFEIGSLTKVFTATILADMVERKELALDDPVGEVPSEGDADAAARKGGGHPGGAGDPQLRVAPGPGQLLDPGRIDL